LAAVRILRQVLQDSAFPGVVLYPAEGRIFGKGEIMSFLKTISMTAFAAVTLLSFGGAQANIISGGLWHVPEATSQNAIPANVPGASPDVTFDVNSPLNFNATSATVAAWLASGLAFNIHENTPGTLASLMDNGGMGTLLRFTGLVTVTTGQ